MSALLKSFFFTQQPIAAPIDLSALGSMALAGMHRHSSWRETRIQHVVAHISSDSLEPSKTPAEVIPEETRITFFLELVFDDAADPSEDIWQPLIDVACLRGALLFSLDAFSNVPVPLSNQASRGGFRRIMLLRRAAPDMASFRDAWFGRHAELVTRLPCIEGYAQDLTLTRRDADGRVLSYEECGVDGIAQICYAGEDAMAASYKAPERGPLRDDGRRLLARVSTMLTQSKVLYRRDPSTRAVCSGLL